MMGKMLLNHAFEIAALNEAVIQLTVIAKQHLEALQIIAKALGLPSSTLKIKEE